MPSADAAFLEAAADPAWSRAGEICRDAAFREAVWRHCRYRRACASLADLHTRVHPNDQMLRHSLRFWDVNRSVSQYYNVALQQHHAAQQVMRALFGEPRPEFTVLDFACGYGRLLRFLTLSFPRERVWASEIQPDAVEFVAREYGVRAIASDADPARFEPGRRFDFVWVASLFSHLPRRLFHAWLARLLAMLEPGGVLCFSVHDQCLLPPGIAMPADGIHFIPASEIEDLDTATYGTTFVTEAFVRAAIAGATPARHPWFRIPRGLANEQDLYVVPRDPARKLDALASFRKGPWGWVDEWSVSEGRELYLRGWAGSLEDGALPSVEIRIAGKVHDCPCGLARPDVARVLGDARLANSGWEFRHVLPGHPVLVEVSAPSNRGEAALLYAGPL
jgi:SAM-dependent methyltransferase